MQVLSVIPSNVVRFSALTIGLPVKDNLTGGKLETPQPEQNKETALITPDQRDQHNLNHTGNTEGAPDTGLSTTVTPVPEALSTDKYIYLSEKPDNKLPISVPVTASNGLKIKSNSKHTPGSLGSHRDAGIEPRNSLELFENSIPTSNPKTRLAIDENGNIHRFFNDSIDGSGTFHWSGSAGDKINPIKRKDLDKSLSH